MNTTSAGWSSSGGQEDLRPNGFHYYRRISRHAPSRVSLVAMKQYWLMKSEPDVFAIQDLAECPGKTSTWEGIRNYQARNHMKTMRMGDEALFYHSSADTIGVAGKMRISGLAEPDRYALDKKSKYHDPAAKPEKNPWLMVRVTLTEIFPEIVTLQMLRKTPGLESMLVLKKGMRLSVQPVTADEFKAVCTLAKRELSTAPLSGEL